jgi:hypothetical protein
MIWVIFERRPVQALILASLADDEIDGFLFHVVRERHTMRGSRPPICSCAGARPVWHPCSSTVCGWTSKCSS